MYANDTSSNENYTGQYNYIVNKDSAQLNLTLDSQEDNITVEVNSVVNITAKSPQP